MSRSPFSLDPTAHWQAQLDCAALLRQYGAIRRICDRALTWLGSDPPSSWLFWRCFARVCEGESASASAELELLAGTEEFALAATALTIQAVRHAKTKDKERLAQLKSDLRTMSKSQSSAGLTLASRYFLFT